jgi:hypothetical protein
MYAFCFEYFTLLESEQLNYYVITLDIITLAA